MPASFVMLVDGISLKIVNRLCTEQGHHRTDGIVELVHKHMNQMMQTYTGSKIGSAG